MPLGDVECTMDGTAQRSSEKEVASGGGTNAMDLPRTTVLDAISVHARYQLIREKSDNR